MVKTKKHLSFFDVGVIIMVITILLDLFNAIMYYSTPVYTQYGLLIFVLGCGISLLIFTFKCVNENIKEGD